VAATFLAKSRRVTIAMMAFYCSGLPHANLQSSDSATKIHYRPEVMGKE